MSGKKGPGPVARVLAVAGGLALLAAGLGGGIGARLLPVGHRLGLVGLFVCTPAGLTGLVVLAWGKEGVEAHGGLRLRQLGPKAGAKVVVWGSDDAGTRETLPLPVGHGHSSTPTSMFSLERPARPYGAPPEESCPCAKAS